MTSRMNHNRSISVNPSGILTTDPATAGFVSLVAPPSVGVVRRCGLNRSTFNLSPGSMLMHGQFHWMKSVPIILLPRRSLEKIIVAITGFVLTGFLAGHLCGNLIVFLGRKPFNDYAQFLNHFMHGAGISMARVLVLVCLLLHVTASVLLLRKNNGTPQLFAYCSGHCSTCEKNVIQTGLSARFMIWSGLTILVFLIYHLLHFTFHIGNTYGSYVDTDFLAVTGGIRLDAWKMVIDGFSVWQIALVYAFSVSLLCSHLAHGVQGIFQTIGLLTKKSEHFIRLLSNGYALFIWVGFISIPIAIGIFRFGR